MSKRMFDRDSGAKIEHMLFCDSCMHKHHFVGTIAKTDGPCGICGVVGLHNDTSKYYDSEQQAQEGEEKPYDKANMTCLFTEKDWDVYERINARKNQVPSNKTLYVCGFCFGIFLGTGISNHQRRTHSKGYSDQKYWQVDREPLVELTLATGYCFRCGYPVEMKESPRGGVIFCSNRSTCWVAINKEEKRLTI